MASEHLYRKERKAQIDINYLGIFLECDIEETGPRRYGGVIDENVYLAMKGHRGIEQSRGVRNIGCIEPHKGHLDFQFFSQ